MSNKVIFGFAIFNLIVNVSCIFLSIVSYIVSTEPIFYATTNDTVVLSQPLWAFVINAVTCAYFTFDYIIRFVCSAPPVWRFPFGALNVCDLLSFLPTYVEWIVESTDANDPSSAAVDILKFLRLLRVLRLFRLMRYSHTMQLAVKSVRKSWQAFLLFAFAVLLNLVFFSSCMYFAETSVCQWQQQQWTMCGAQNTTTSFQSISATFYWNIITITTVGYGDVVPTTKWGKVVACFAAISGVLMLSFPVSVLGTNFQMMYQEHLQKQREKKEEKPTTDSNLEFGSSREALLSCIFLAEQITKMQEQRKKLEESLMHATKSVTKMMISDI